MKISFRPAQTGGAASTYSVLADESNPTLQEKISQYQAAASKNPMEVPGYQSASVLVLDLGNVKWKLGFIIERVHATPDAALAFIVQQQAAVAGIGAVDLAITVGAQTDYFPACVVTEFTPEPHSDQSSKIKYGFAGANYSLTAP